MNTKDLPSTARKRIKRALRKMLNSRPARYSMRTMVIAVRLIDHHRARREGSR